MSVAHSVSQILDPLVDAWCERRALRPLSCILSAYPMPQWLTDDCFRLLEALKDTRGLCYDVLTPEERIGLTKAKILLQEALEKSKGNFKSIRYRFNSYCPNIQACKCPKIV